MNDEFETRTIKEIALSKTSLRPLFATKYDQSFFVNREKELSSIQSSIRSKLNLLLLGKRGSGKTSLLNHAYYDLKKDKKIIVILVNILPKGIHGTETFLDVLVRSCAKEISGNEMHSELYHKYITTFQTLSGLVGFETIMAILNRENKQAVFIIDGFDHNSELCYNIVSALREIFWETKSAFIVTGDLLQKNVYLKPPVDAFFDKVVEIEKLSTKDVKKLFEHRIGKNEITEKVFSALAKYGADSIADIILMMRENIEKDNQKFDSILKTSNSFTMGATIIPPSKQFDKNLQKISPMRKEVLKYLRVNGPTSASDKKFQEYTGVSRSRLAQMLVRLMHMGFLTKSQDSQKRRALFGLTTEARNRLTHE